MTRFAFRPTLTFRGRTFKGLRGWSGKPLHPPLTDFPIVAYVLAAAFDDAETGVGDAWIDADDDHALVFPIRTHVPTWG